MWYVIAILAILVVGFNVLSARYANPHKLIFIFGKKGSGKSTYMVKLMIKHLKHGWTCYTNMGDVNINGVRVFDAQQLANCVPTPHSVLFIDEAGLLWDNRNFKNFDSRLTEFFKLQRKYRCKIYVNSQAFDVDKKIRDLTDSMMLQTNIGNLIGISRPILRKIHLTEATSQADSRIADSLKFGSVFSWSFTWLPRYFKYFNSFEAPKRPAVSFQEVKDGITLLSTRSVLEALRGLSERKKKNDSIRHDQDDDSEQD